MMIPFQGPRGCGLLLGPSDPRVCGARGSKMRYPVSFMSSNGIIKHDEKTDIGEHHTGLDRLQKGNRVIMFSL